MYSVSKSPGNGDKNGPAIVLGTISLSMNTLSYEHLRYLPSNCTTDLLEAYNRTEDFYHKHPLKLMQIYIASLFEYPVPVQHAVGCSIFKRGSEMNEPGECGAHFHVIIRLLAWIGVEKFAIVSF